MIFPGGNWQDYSAQLEFQMNESQPEVPSWAKAEQMARSFSLTELWRLSPTAKEPNPLIVLIKKLFSSGRKNVKTVRKLEKVYGEGGS